MPFLIELSQEEVDFICGLLRRSQEELVRYIRTWNVVMGTCYGDKGDAPEIVQKISVFNGWQKFLQKLAEKASDDFKKRLQPDDLKLWEELSPKTRGLEPDKDGDDEDNIEEETGRLIVTDAAIWQRKKDGS